MCVSTSNTPNRSVVVSLAMPWTILWIRQGTSIPVMKFMYLPWIWVLVEMKFSLSYFRRCSFSSIFCCCCFTSLFTFRGFLIFVGWCCCFHYVREENFPMFGILFGCSWNFCCYFYFYLSSLRLLCSSFLRRLREIIWSTNINSAQGDSSRLYFGAEELVRNCQSFA